jgi:hypothetical protein
MLGHTTGVGSSSKRPDQLETRLRERLNHSAPLHAPSCSTFSCCRTSSEPTGSESSGATPESCAFAELLACEEDRTLRAVLVGMLREGDRRH